MQSSEMTKAANKAAKRRNRNKRRKKQTRNQERPGNQETPPTAKTTRSQRNIKTSFTQPNQDVHLQRRLRLWRETYINAVQWHCDHQMNYWRHRAEQLQLENEQLRDRQSERDHIVLEYDTSEEEESEKDEIGDGAKSDPVLDAEYLEFLAVTQKHREELKMSRQIETANEGTDF